MKMEREVALEHRNRLARMAVDKEEFVNKLRDGRMSVYKVSHYQFYQIAKMLVPQKSPIFSKNSYISLFGNILHL